VTETNVLLHRVSPKGAGLSDPAVNGSPHLSITQVTLGWVTSNFLSMLTPRLQFGRLFLPEEQGSGRAHVVILSYELWRTRYGSDPAILGHAILLNGQPYTVVGILPAGFKLIFPDGAAVPPRVDVYSPFQADLAGQPRDQEYIRTIATLRRGISVQSAQSELSSFAAQLRSGFHEYSEQDLHLQIVPLQQDATDAIRAPLLALFAGSGLLVRTFLDVLHVNPGFDAGNVLTFRISLLGEHYTSTEVDRQFLIELERRLDALPGVLHAGFVSHLPFDDALPNWYDYAWRKDAPAYEQNTLMADHRAASAGFFESLGAQFISGRNFDTSDETSRRKVAIIDDVLARQLWPGQSALGKAINVETQHDGDSAREVAEVIGVVKHLDFHSLTLPERGQVYLPYRMAARANMYFILRAESSPLYLIPLVRQQLAGMDKELPVAAAKPMDDYVLKARTESRFVAVLFGSIAVIALLLSCLGIYGITANSVTRRTREIGIRMALGASPVRIVRLVFATSIRPIGGGAMAGVGLSFGFTPLLSGLLFGVRPVSTPILVGVFLFLSLVGLMAIMIPTARVLRGNPMSALRYE
jgi:hypothetical protein